MCGSTKSSTFVQQRSTCWAHACTVPSVSKNCHGSLASFPCSLQCPRSWALSLCCCSILYCFYAKSTLLFYHIVFSLFVLINEFAYKKWSLLFWGDEYTSDSQPWFNMRICKILRMLNMLSHCWGHLKNSLDNTPTNTQHVESLYSEQIQCICTRSKGYTCSIKNLTLRPSCEATTKTTRGVRAGLSICFLNNSVPSSSK